MERREPATFGGRAEEARRNDGRSVRDGIPPLDDDGRGHHCGARVYRSCISSKQERAGHRVEPGTGIHPNRTTKGYARICVGCWWTEGEGEIGYMVESRSSRWTPQEDALFRQMAEANVRPEIIATKLNRTVHAVKARAYMIGLPLRWFLSNLRGSARASRSRSCRSLPKGSWWLPTATLSRSSTRSTLLQQRVGN